MLRDDALLVSRFGTAGKAQVVPLIQANRNPFVRAEPSAHRVVALAGRAHRRQRAHHLPVRLHRPDAAPPARRGPRQ
ncbi:hypothetical protein [Spongiactinospora sp. TRM90649]|uniref:hypothetical protein n=1 Tax=Spongiactinospora sp. TRM90649 TaxID=3031114 RepID=UPI0023FA3A39|nr:hypothetical protein [Spongiactinospora sp. TRM90649]MDF5757471.1 hypothetical protein [Spongiactinospora sp. TRM90649]